MIFITTHSHPTTGYLHIGPGNVGCVPVQEVKCFILFIYFKFLNHIPAFACHISSPLSNHLAEGKQEYPRLFIMWFTFELSKFKDSDKEFRNGVRS